MTRTQLRIVNLLAATPGEYVSVDTLREKLWGGYISREGVAVHVMAIRRQLWETPFRIDRWRGKGYRLVRLAA